MVTRTVTSGMLGGTGGNDTLTGIAQRGTGQIHVYAKEGNDAINLSFGSNINTFSHGHHARGDRDGNNNRGADTFNFQNLNNVDDVMVGRIEDFDPTRDQLSINGDAISLSQLQNGSGTTGGFSWRTVEYDADSRDSASDKQQWLLIDTGPGYVFYALEGARVTNGDGAANGGGQESHFIGAGGGHRVTKSELDALATVGFVDPENFVPDGYTAQGGVTITDYDTTYADAQARINGTGNGDLIAAGLNDDHVRAGSGNDVVWGGSGRDRINGDNGDDTIYGGTGNDRLVGGRGNDEVYGGRDNDVLNGWGGNDRMYGEDGKDRLYGQQGNDTLDGGGGNDKMYGSTDDDLLLGGSGNDLLNGGQGSDVATGGSGADTFEFQSGDLVDWDNLGGSATARSAQLDLITDFTIGSDKIEFDNYANVDSMSDLRAWKTTLDGNVHFTVQVRATNERILVDVQDGTSWSTFFDADNFQIV